jgi:hypothetical protein
VVPLHAFQYLLRVFGMPGLLAVGGWLLEHWLGNRK